MKIDIKERMFKSASLSNSFIDQQDDERASVWNSIAYYWPPDLLMPEIGVDFEKSSCPTNVNGKSRFPIDSPESTLASSMYFLIDSVKSFNKEAQLEIAKGLKEYRDIWDIDLPEEFVQDLRSVGHQKVAEDFSDHMNEDYSCGDASIHAENAIKLREEVISGIDHPDKGEYLSKMAELKDRLSWDSPESIANDLRIADELSDMSVGWGAYYPDPNDSVFSGVEIDPMSVFEKSASYDESDYDWGSMSEVLEEDIVSQIKEDPGAVIPTLPIHHKDIVESFRRK
jgi:hypothetical protein